VSLLLGALGFALVDLLFCDLAADDDERRGLAVDPEAPRGLDDPEAPRGLDDPEAPRGLDDPEAPRGLADDAEAARGLADDALVARGFAAAAVPLVFVARPLAALLFADLALDERPPAGLLLAGLALAALVVPALPFAVRLPERDELLPVVFLRVLLVVAKGPPFQGS
jgi:hypothetical protein